MKIRAVKAACGFRRVRFVRALSCALLVCVSHNAIFEVAHQHGGDIAHSISRIATETRKSFVRSDDARGSQGSAQNVQCLICQMQHCLSDGLLAAPISVPFKIERTNDAAQGAILQRSLAAARRRSRAPPFLSLA